MTNAGLPASAQLKLELMFDGVRYSDAMGAAASHAFPNYYPYRFTPGEPNPTGKDRANIPYLMTLEDETLVRIKGAGDSPWVITGSQPAGYQLEHRDGRRLQVDFPPLPRWMGQTTSDGFPMAQAGISLHADMLVVNVAPGCEYFLEKGADGHSMRCAFCAYGAPNERVAHFNQTIGTASLPAQTYARMREVLAAALAEQEIRHIYLVGGSMTDWVEEGRRFIEVAREVQAVNQRRIPVSCGSGAIPRQAMELLAAERLVEQACFNLEVWSEDLFARVCPGKNRFVGYQCWIDALEQAVAVFGRGRVYSAMVAGIELEPEYAMTWEQAAELAIRGAEDLCSRGIIPIYSLYWPTGGRDHPDYFSRLTHLFETLNLEYKAIRDRYGLAISPDFMCHRCAYMQLECDIDRAQPM
jgi:hypothetical protein